MVPPNAACQSEGAQAGEIQTGALEGRLGLVGAGKGKKLSGGWELRPALGEDLATLKCGSATMSIRGSVVGGISAMNKSSKNFGIAFKASKGKQLPEALEGEAKSTLTLLSGSGEEAIALSLHGKIANEELDEMKTGE